MKYILALAMALTTQAFAHADCFPRHPDYEGMKITSDVTSGVTEEQFDQVLDKIELVYGPIIRQLGKTLVVNKDWKDGTPNAYAHREGNEWHITMLGGLARLPGMNQMAFAIVACHELGHHLGRFPKYGRNSDWAATEGQADYFATLKCMKRMGWASTAGAKALATVMAKLLKMKPPSRSTRDKSVMLKTFESHPGPQCRLDTYDMGYLCLAKGNFSDTNPKKGACHIYPTKKTYWPGSRPRCWFAP